MQIGHDHRNDRSRSPEYAPSSFQGSRGTKLPATVRYDYSIPRTLNQVKGLLRTSLPTLIVGGAIWGITEGLDWVIESGELKKREFGAPAFDPDYRHWTVNNASGVSLKSSTPSALCSDLQANSGYSGGPGSTPASHTMISPSQASCKFYYRQRLTTDPERTSTYTMTGVGTNCPSGYAFDADLGHCTSTQRIPVSESDFELISSLDTSEFNPELLQDILEESCSGSGNPEGCLQSLRDNQSLSGPSTLAGPSTTTTSTYAKPDGTVGERSTTTTNNYKITYGDNNYTYTRNSTSVITEDGVVTGTEETSESDDVTEEERAEEEIAAPCAEDCDGPAYEDLYSPTDDTKESLLDDYITRVQAIPLFAAIGGFFDVSVSASCPVWQQEISAGILGSDLSFNLVFDYHCQPWFVDYQPYAAAAFLIVGAFFAFRVGFL